MAKADWCTVAPMEGKENGTITISAPAHTGRAERSTVVIVQAANGTKPTANIVVNQASPGAILTMDSSKPDVPKEGGVVVIHGKSNLSHIYRVGGVLNPNDNTIMPAFPTPNILEINGQALPNDMDVPGDPGVTAQYDFKVTITLSKSLFPKDMPVTFRISDVRSGGDITTHADCTFIWRAGASSLSTDKSSLSLAKEESNGMINITSNDDWTVS